jgi:hypothetical protein
MILAMIQGCRYLRRSTDRCLLSKNSTTRLEGLELARGRFVVKLFDDALQTLRIHVDILVLTWLLIDYEYNIHCLNNTPRRCPSCTSHQFVSSLYSGHVITYSRTLPLLSTKQSLCRMMACSRPQASLPNASRKTSCQMISPYLTRPTSQSLSCTNFWC